MSFLVDEFSKKIYVTKIDDINNIKEYLKFSLDLETDTQSLLIDIRGRFVKNTCDAQTKTYKILSDMINNKDSNIAVLQKILK